MSFLSVNHAKGGRKMNNKTISIDGKNKTIKFVEVNEEKKRVGLYFTDFTFITLEDVKIIHRGNTDKLSI